MYGGKKFGLRESFVLCKPKCGVFHTGIFLLVFLRYLPTTIWE